MKKLSFYFALLLLPAGVIFAQELRNANFEFKDNKVTVTYTLANVKEGQTFDVVLLYSSNNGSKWQTAQSTSGDVGKNVSPGTNRRIVWNLLSDLPDGLNGSIGFKIRATVYEPEQPPAGNDPFAGQMVLIEGGTFMMGSPDTEADRSSDEFQHKVTVSSFKMGKYEVTQAQWQAIMGSNPSYFKNCDQCPVEQVSHDDIQEFLNKLNTKTGKKYRLPTEAEWEYAARGGTSTPFNTGNCLSTDQANYNGNYPYQSCSKGTYREKTVAVGSFAPNQYGLYDMHGNVWEWCSDWYNAGYYKNSPANNPQGPSTGSYRVLRGGSWYRYAQYCRPAIRYINTPDIRHYGYGFRLVVVP